jgi:hypothetical protein
MRDPRGYERQGYGGEITGLKVFHSRQSLYNTPTATSTEQVVTMVFPSTTADQLLGSHHGELSRLRKRAPSFAPSMVNLQVDSQGQCTNRHP